MLPEDTKAKLYVLMKFLLKEKHITLNNTYIKTYLKTGVYVELQDFFRGVFVLKVKEHWMFFEAVMNHIPNNFIRNSKLINLKENQDINKSIGSGYNFFEKFQLDIFLIDVSLYVIYEK